ncbi:MAG TPA: Fe-S protein assembly co-chaperone HscB [Polyangiaceae bacterium]|jgi:molecular chaperone HscB
MFDPFTILGLPRRFDVDLRAAEKNHRELSRVLHPDKYAGGSATERREALTKAADVNEAWRILRDPVRRAEALFQLEGIAVGETNEPKPDPELLMEVLEKREALADAKNERDVDKVRALEAEVEAREKKIEETLASAKSFDGALVAKLGEMRFYRRFLEEASAVEEELAG